MEEEMRREERALAEQAQGLRFDIYERVRLSEEVKGIEQLEEIELLPHIQVVSVNEQAVLKGHLLLSGKFAGGDDARSAGSLEHAIPVEITLPMNRIPNLNDISVEIENFDVDVVSPQTLNITGVLSLNGIEVLPVSNEWKPREDAEEVFVYKAPDAEPDSWASREEETVEEAAEAEQTAFSAFREEEQAASVRSAEESPAVGGGADRMNESAEIDEQATPPPIETDVPTAAAIQAEEEAAAAVRAEEPAEQPAEETFEEALNAANEELQALANEEILANEAMGNEGLNEAFDDGQSEEQLNQTDQNAKPESGLKIAFASKSREEEKPAQLASLLESSEAQAAQRRADAAEAEKAAEEREARSVKEAAGWKSLFLSQENEETKFSSLRICIVQKEETIETIAERYRLHPSELAMYNRLSEPSVHEGQVIYIPK
jgi:stage VI sporulation protein D